MEIGAQPGESDFTQPRKQQLLRVTERLAETGIHGLLNEAIGRPGPIADGEERWTPQRGVNIAQRDLRQLAGQPPAAAMALLGSHVTSLAQSRHGPTDHHGIRTHGFRQGLRGDGAVDFGHVQKNVQRVGQSAIESHVTTEIT